MGLTINFVLIVRKDDHRRRRLLQAFEQVHHLGFLLDILDFLNDIQIGSTSSTNVDCDRLDK